MTNKSTARRTFAPTVFWILNALLLLDGATEARAQLTGTVVDSEGAALAGASVEAWGQSGRLATRISGSEGHFWFNADIDAQTTRVIVDLIGYRTTATRSALATRPLVIRLEVQPVPLPELIVAATRARCPASDQDEARDLWKRAASRYADNTQDFAGNAVVLEAQGPISEDLIGSHEAVDLEQVGRVWRGASWPPEPIGRTNIDKRVERDGYVRKSHDNRWVYPNLAGLDASHFASSTFGDLHNFIIVSADSEVAVVQFCPVSDPEGTISGTLHLSPEGQLLEARWTFASADPTQEAGGEVFFSEFVETSSDELHLVSARGAFWRHTPGVEAADGSRSFWQLLQVFNNVQLMRDRNLPREY